MAIYTPLWLNIDSLVHPNMQEQRYWDGEGWEGILMLFNAETHMLYVFITLL